MAEQATEAEVQDLRQKLDNVKRELADAVRIAKDRVVTGTATWAKEHPAAAIGIGAGIAAGIGFLVGMLVGRNRN